MNSVQEPFVIGTVFLERVGQKCRAVTKAQITTVSLSPANPEIGPLARGSDWLASMAVA